MIPDRRRHNVDRSARGTNTYGYAGAPVGAEIEITAPIRSISAGTPGSGPNGALTLAAGDSPDGVTVSVIRANATLDLYNKTAIPIPIPPDPKVRVNATADIFIDTSGNATNAGIRSAGDMALYADRGTITMSAVGTGKDIYREALAAAASAVSNLFGGGNITFDYHGGSTGQTGLATLRVDGVAITGIQRTKFLTLSYDSNYNLLVDTNGISYSLDPNASAGGTLLFRLSELQNLLVAYGADPIARGAYASEILFLKQKLIAMGLATGDPTGNDAAHPFNIGAWAQGIQAAYAQVARDKQIINGASSQVSSTAGLVINGNAFFDSNGATAINLANDASGQWANSTSLADSLLSTIAGFHNTAAAGYAAARAAVIAQQGRAGAEAGDRRLSAGAHDRAQQPDALQEHDQRPAGRYRGQEHHRDHARDGAGPLDAAYVAIAADVAALKTATDNYNVAWARSSTTRRRSGRQRSQLATAIADLRPRSTRWRRPAKTAADDTAYNGTVTSGLTRSTDTPATHDGFQQRECQRAEHAAAVREHHQHLCAPGHDLDFRIQRQLCDLPGGLRRPRQCDDGPERHRHRRRRRDGETRQPQPEGRPRDRQRRPAFAGRRPDQHRQQHGEHPQDQQPHDQQR